MAAGTDTRNIVIETGGKRLKRSERRELKRQAMLRYEKQRRRNRLAKPGIHDVCLVLDHLKAGFNVAKIFLITPVAQLPSQWLLNNGTV